MADANASNTHPTDIIIATIARLYRSVRVEDVQTAFEMRETHHRRIARRMARKFSGPGRRNAEKLW